jgi:prepilin-type processing-associated H-X9-DG protein
VPSRRACGPPTSRRSGRRSTSPPRCSTTTFRDEQGATRIVLYEDAPGPDGRGVGYADGHVQFMREDKFREAISAQQEKDKADAGGAAKPK